MAIKNEAKVEILDLDARANYVLQADTGVGIWFCMICGEFGKDSKVAKTDSMFNAQFNRLTIDGEKHVKDQHPADWAAIMKAQAPKPAPTPKPKKVAVKKTSAKTP